MANGYKLPGRHQVLSRGWTDEEKALLAAEIARQNARPETTKLTSESDVVKEVLVPELRRRHLPGETMRTNAEQNPNASPNDRTALVSDGMITVVEAAALLGVGRSMVYDLMDKGRLPHAKLGRARRIPRRAVLDFAAAALVGGVARDG